MQLPLAANFSRRAMIIEDDAGVQSLLRHLMLLQKWEPIGYITAHEALAGFQESFFPLLILDVQLPGMDGLTLCRQIRLLPGGAECAIIVLTAVINPENLHLALDAGADDYIFKPLDSGLFKIRLQVAERLVKERLERRELQIFTNKSQQQFQDLMTYSPIATGVIGPSGEITYLNYKFSELFGYTLRDIPTNQDWFLRAYPDPIYRDEALQIWNTDVQQAIATGTATPPRNYRVVCNNGTVRDVEIVMSPIDDMFIAIFNDVTARVRAEAELRERDVILNNFFESPGAMRGIVELVEDDIQHVADNEIAAAFFGYNQETMRNKLASEMGIPHDVIQFWRSKYEESRQTGQVVRFEYKHATSAAELWFSATVSFLGLTDNGKLRYAYVVSDVTDQMRHEAEIKKASEQAEAANRAKNAFLANMSHELRTPLNAIMGFAQILAKEPGLTRHQQEDAEIIYKSGQHLLTLISDILDYTKIEAGRFDLELRDVHLKSTLRTIIDMVQILAQQKGLTFNYQEVNALPLVVYTDEKRLRQILLNLLSNAVKFTLQGHITFTIEYLENCLRFDVIDSGIGIPEQYLELIFEPFHQIKDPRLFSEGTGMSLCISRQLADKLGGELKVESQVGKGTRFWFVLPLPLKLEQARPVEINWQNLIAVENPDNKKLALIVDDVRTNRLMLRTMLTKLGFLTQEATNGLEALILLDSHKPDVILLDLVMPEMDGFAFLRHARATETLKNLPIIVVSANAFELTRQEALDAGATDFLIKPLQMNLLAGCLQNHLGLKLLKESPAQPVAGADSVLNLPPNKVELLAMKDFAFSGDLTSLTRQLERLQTVHPAFVGKMEVLLDDFRFDDISAEIDKVLLHQTD